MTLSYVLLLIASVAVFVCLCVFLENRSREVETASLKYEECVLRETGSSPSGFYLVHGYYPECSN